LQKCRPFFFGRDQDLVPVRNLLAAD